MFRSLSNGFLAAGLAVGLFLGSAPGSMAQTTEVVSKVATLGADEARLNLEFSDGSSMELALTDGVVQVGDQELGSYTPGGALEAAWRDLVARAVSLDDQALLQALVDWAPPAGLEGEAARVADRLDELMAREFDTAAIRARTLAESEEAELLTGLEGLQSLRLLSRLEILSGLGDAVQELDDGNLRVVVDDHLEVAAGTELDASLLVVDGSLEIRGTVRGDVLVVDGDVELYPGSRIVGTLNLADARLDNDGGEITGGVERVEAQQRSMEEELRSEILRELRSEMGLRDEDRRRIRNPLRSLGNAMGNIMGTLIQVLILGGIGALLLHFAAPNMDTVAEVARNSTGRAAVVGFAGAALLLPVFILGIVGLAVTIVGIPAIVLWVLLFPAAVILAGLMGYLAVARNLGTWLARQRYSFTEWVRVTNPLTLIFGGLLVLVAPFVAGEVVGIVGFLGVFQVLLTLAGVTMTVFAGAVGFGAVLLTRGGRKPEDWGRDMFAGGWRRGPWSPREPEWPGEDIPDEDASDPGTQSEDLAEDPVTEPGTMDGDDDPKPGGGHHA